MAHFVKGGAVLTPFGKNVYLRSTVGCKFESYTLAASLVPARTIDGVAGQKIVQPGTVMVKITSGAESGKIAPLRAGAADGQAVLDSAGVVTIAGILDTFLPWQTIERDVEVAVLTEGTVVQAWCFEYDSGGNQITVLNATVDRIIGGVAGSDSVWRSKRLDIKFA